jgi:glycosyltransferase involved in cell wall biosynthesis
LQALRRYRPSAIWSTYPIATAHSIAATIARLSGVPWIADFRDPMAQEGYPADPATWRSYDELERLTLTRAARVTFTTPGAVRLYQERYPDRTRALRLLENGYDESAFASRRAGDRGALNSGRLTLLHSGVVYPDERNPTQLFQALADLKRRSPEAFARLVVRFRAPGHPELINALSEKHGIGDAIEVLPSVPYTEAIDEMCRADGLLLLQASNCNAQIPAKFYEYVRAQRPILLMTDPVGDTAVAARGVGIAAAAQLDDAPSIERLLSAFCACDTGEMLADVAGLEQTSRRARTRELAQLLDEIAASS